VRTVRWLVAVTLALPLLFVAAPASAGTLVVMPGHGPTVGHGTLVRYRVAIDSGITRSPADFALRVQAVLGDVRGWGHRFAFRRVSAAPYRFTIVLASRATTDRLCYPFRTNGLFSCYNNARVVINDYRWRLGAATYAGQLSAYRTYLVSHETGHALGYRQHPRACLASGLAPVMMQQTKSLYGCRRNPWPYPSGR
jgi:hypothetical protein